MTKKRSFFRAVKAPFESRISIVRAIVIVLFLASTVFLCSSKAAQNDKPQTAPATVVQEHLPPDEPSEAEDFYLLKRVRPGETQLPIERYLKARQEARSLRRYSSSLGAYLSETSGQSAFVRTPFHPTELQQAQMLPR
jgi:hypothetical protein